MNKLIYILGATILFLPHVSFSSENEVLGVWKKLVGKNYPQKFIEFRENGDFIKGVGRWTQENKKNIQKFTFFKGKYKNLNVKEKQVFLTLKEKTDGFVSLLSNMENVKHKLVLGKTRLYLTPPFRKSHIVYVRLNSEYFDLYNKALKIYGKGLQLPDKSIQARVGDKTIKIVKPKGEGKILAIMPLVYVERGKKKVSPVLKTLMLNIKGEKVLTPVVEFNSPVNKFKVGDVVYWKHQQVFDSRSLPSLFSRYPDYSADNFIDIMEVKIKNEVESTAAQYNASDLLVKKRKGRIVKHIFKGVKNLPTVSELEIEGKIIVTRYANKELNVGDIITWVWSNQRYKAVDYPDMYSLYDAKLYNGKLATINPLKRAKIIEVFTSRKGSYAYKADLNGELVWLLAFDLQIDNKKIKPNDTIIWSMSKAKKEFLKLMIQERMLPTSILNSKNENIRELQIYDVEKLNVAGRINSSN